MAVTNSGAIASVTLPNVTAANSGDYDVVLTNNFGAMTSAVVTVTVLDASYSGGGDVVKYRMGDNDPGAADGGPGNAVTKDGLGTNDLAAFGSPFYSGEVPAGGGAFSMLFDGAQLLPEHKPGRPLQESRLQQLQPVAGCLCYWVGRRGFSFPISMGGRVAAVSRSWKSAAPGTCSTKRWSKVRSASR